MYWWGIFPRVVGVLEEKGRGRDGEGVVVKGSLDKRSTAGGRCRGGQWNFFIIKNLVIGTVETDLKWLLPAPTSPESK